MSDKCGRTENTQLQLRVDPQLGFWSCAFAVGWQLVFVAELSLLEPSTARTASCCFSACMGVLSCWLAWYCCRFKITATETCITYRGFVRSRTFGRQDIQHLVWGTSTRWGNCKLIDAERRVRIDFGMLQPNDRPLLANWIREYVPLDVQQNWPRFHALIVLAVWPKCESILDFV